MDLRLLRLLSLILPFAAPVVSGSRATAAEAVGPTPQFDIEATCRDQARYAFAATLGQSDIDKEFALCSERERAMRLQVDLMWPRASAASRRDCVPLADAKSGAKYSMLARCLDGPR